MVEYLTDQERSDEWAVQYAMAFHSGVGGQMLALSQETVDDLFSGMCVGYRFVNGVLCRIVNEEEIKSIESAIAESPDAVAEQLNKALLAFADRAHPNYANAVKESISAVESQCCILTGNPKASLGDALKKLEALGVKIHPALGKALHQIYGYTWEILFYLILHHHSRWTHLEGVGFGLSATDDCRYCACFPQEVSACSCRDFRVCCV